MCHKKSPRNGIHDVSIADRHSYTSVCAVAEVGELVATKSKNWVMGQTISKSLQEEANRCKKKQKEVAKQNIITRRSKSLQEEAKRKSKLI